MICTTVIRMDLKKEIMVVEEYSYECVCMNIPVVLHVSIGSGVYATSLGCAHVLILVIVVIVTVIFLCDIGTVELLALIKVNFTQGAKLDDERFVELRLQKMHV